VETLAGVADASLLSNGEFIRPMVTTCLHVVLTLKAVAILSLAVFDVDIAWDIVHRFFATFAYNVLIYSCSSHPISLGIPLQYLHLVSTPAFLSASYILTARFTHQ
jgi:hypothetical protein